MRGWALRHLFLRAPRWQNAFVIEDQIVGGPFSARVIPLRPLWHRFAGNTFFYAIALWLLISGPFVLRRFIRRRRGLCPKCAYPAGESAVCTECGQELAT